MPKSTNEMQRWWIPSYGKILIQNWWKFWLENKNHEIGHTKPNPHENENGQTLYNSVFDMLGKVWENEIKREKKTKKQKGLYQWHYDVSTSEQPRSNKDWNVVCPSLIGS